MTALKGGIAQPIKRHGGKAYLADWIIGEMPGHTRYVEPYFGAGSVLFRKSPEGVAEFVNDADGELMNFWNVIADPHTFGLFERAVQCIPLSREHWKRSSAIAQAELDDIPFSQHKRAADFFLRYRQSRQGLGKDYVTPTRRLRRGMNEQVSCWLSAVDGLPEAHERMRRVEIFDANGAKAVACIKRLDLPETLFYCDPPYLHSTRSTTVEYGRFEMTDADHVELLETLAGIEGRFLLSGYPSDLYADFAARYGWACVTREIDNKASSAKEKRKQTECLWKNF